MSNLFMRGCMAVATGVFVLFAGPAARAQDYGDTPYVQTPQNIVDRMLEVAKVTASDYVIDLGSGDGRMIITAAKRYGARGFGVDLDKRLVALANKNAAKAGVANRARFYARDLYETDVSPASVVTIYLLPEVNLMVRPKLLSTLKPGTRLVSHDYDFGEWPPDHTEILDAPDKPVGRDRRSKIFYYVIPGKAAGMWRWALTNGSTRQEYQLAVQQNFQKVKLELKVDGVPATVENAALTGDELAFTAQLPGNATRLVYRGRILNHGLDGEVREQGGGAAVQKWNASRSEVWEPAHLLLPPPVMGPPPLELPPVEKR